MTQETIEVLGIGNAIVDVLTHAGDDFLEENGLTKGAMTLVDAGHAEELYGKLTGTVECSGGSAANTMAGIASFGGAGAYIGKLGEDRLGRTFAEDIRRTGLRFETPASKDGPPTGRCLVLVTPDAQRTMQTFLGAAATLAPEDIDPAFVEAAQITYLEGYLWDPPPAKEALLRAAEIAHRAGRKVALSLSDSFCVGRHRAEFRELIRDHIDVVFANEDEALSLVQTAEFETAAEALREWCDVAAVTRGANGSSVLARDTRIDVEARTLGPVVDTTGAGDLYAAGFLFGLTRGRGLAECGRLGSLAAAEVISHFGARPEVDLARLAAETGEESQR
jgi:sugar/nucleoside kinase (ribokinase family)